MAKRAATKKAKGPTVKRGPAALVRGARKGAKDQKARKPFKG